MDKEKILARIEEIKTRELEYWDERFETAAFLAWLERLYDEIKEVINNGM